VHSKKLKYQRYLSAFPDCPPGHFQEVSRLSFRWVFGMENENNFQPLNLKPNPPQRILDETDMMCMGFGLSFYDSLKNAFGRYKSLYQKRRAHQRPQFINDKGAFIAAVSLDSHSGIADEPNITNYGHFTFHEYELINLNDKITKLTSIFESDGTNFNKTI
jgi:hypothetical protein